MKTIGIGAPAIELAIGAGGVWVATGGFGEVVRIEPRARGGRRSLSARRPRRSGRAAAISVGVGDGRVWVGAFGGLAQIEPPSGEVVEPVDLGFGERLQIAVGDGAVWATTIANRAKRVEASSGRETAEYYAGGWLVPNRAWRRRGLGRRPPRVVEAGSGHRRRALLVTTERGDVVGIADGEDAVWADGRHHSEARAFRIPQTGAVETRIAIGGLGLEAAVRTRARLWVVVVPTPVELRTAVNLSRRFVGTTPGTTSFPATIRRRSSSTCRSERARDLRADPAEPDRAVAHRQDGVRAGANLPCLYLPKQSDEAGVVAA